MPIAAAYEDIRLAPRSSLLYELESENIVFPRSDGLEDVDDSLLLTSDMSQSDQTEIVKRSSARDMQQGDQIPLESELLKETEIQHSSEFQRDDDQNIRIDKDDDDIESLPTMNFGNLDEFLVDDPENVDKEPALWAMNSLLTAQNDNSSLENPQIDTGEASDPPCIDKDIGKTKLFTPPKVPFNLESSEQTVLQQIHEVVGDRQVSEFELQFAPRWILEKAIANEKEN